MTIALVARVRAVLRRFSRKETDTPNHPVSVGPIRLDPATFDVTLSGHSIRLTGTELRLLEVLMRAVGQVQSREYRGGGGLKVEITLPAAQG